MLSHFLRCSGNSLVTGNLAVSYIDTAQTVSSGTTLTRTGVNIGTPDDFRRVVVGVGIVGSSSGDTINTVTVNGNPLTKHIEDSGAVGIAIFSAIIKSGSTATITVTFSASVSMAIHVFTVTGATSSFRGASSANGSASSITTSPQLTVGSNDVGVFVASQQSANAVSETSSPGGSSSTLSESYDQTFSASSTRRTAAGRITYNASSSSAAVTLTGDASTTKRIALATFTSP